MPPIIESDDIPGIQRLIHRLSADRIDIDLRARRTKRAPPYHALRHPEEKAQHDEEAGQAGDDQSPGGGEPLYSFLRRGEETGDPGEIGRTTAEE